MNYQKPENENYKIARELSNKFDFYFIALVFTILGLSIQTSSLGKIFSQYIFEIAAWVFFLASGLAGLSRLEWMSVFYQHHGAVQDKQRTIDMLDQGIKGRAILKSIGETWTIDELKEEEEKVKKQVILRKKEIEKVDKWILLKYRIHKWAFIIGIVVLIISRSIVGLNNLFHIEKIQPIATQSSGHNVPAGAAK